MIVIFRQLNFLRSSFKIFLLDAKEAIWEVLGTLQSESTYNCFKTTETCRDMQSAQ